MDWLSYDFDTKDVYENFMQAFKLNCTEPSYHQEHMDRAKRIWYLSPMRAAKVQASLRIRAVSPEPPLLAHTSSESRGTFRQKARSLAPLNVWACAVKICHDGMLEDTNSLDGAHIKNKKKSILYRFVLPFLSFIFITSVLCLLMKVFTLFTAANRKRGFSLATAPCQIWNFHWDFFLRWILSCHTWQTLP